MERSLTGQIVIISGGLGDIGRATALELARRGADVAISDIRADSDAGELLSSLKSLGVRGRYARVDVTDAAAVAAWIADVEKTWATPTLVVVNAAGVTVKSIRDVTPQQWAKELRTNLDGAFHMAQTAAQRMVAARRPGRIVFLGSVAGHLPNPNIPAYCVAKAGLRMLCKCMALDLAAHGILVNEVAPGYVDAGLSAQNFRDDPPLKEICREHVPIKLLIEPEEVAREVAHLCDPANRHMTGSVLLMDGGITLAGPAQRRQ
jgi:NAD(P)-dependent dehydrogenase (short-subunit alcohol dehydrogenase family)